jgi:hypothetical protein
VGFEMAEGSEDRMKGTKKCTTCNKNKPINGWTNETFNDPIATVCKKCNPQASGKPKKIKRKSSQREGLPKVFPIESFEAKTEDINKSIESDGAVLLTWFRDKVGIPGSISNVREELSESVRQHFSEHTVRDLDWQNVARIKDTKRTTHPYISDINRLTLILERQGSTIKDSDFKDALTYAVHDYIIQEAQFQWTILGDETGQFEEFAGRKGSDGRISTMIWVVIPPQSSLPKIPNLYFHATGSHGELLPALHDLLNESNVRIYSFSYEEGRVVSGQNGIGGDPHLYMWNDTLPLVIEHLINNEEVKLPMQVFVEQVKELQSGIGVLDSLISEYKTSLQSRVWSQLEVKESFVLQKRPCEHPWMGYPDAVGHFFGPQAAKNLGEVYAQLEERIIASPYRQSSLNGSIRQLHKDTARPLVFLQSLSDISLSDQRDYVEVFFSHAITECLSKLNNAEWERLLRHMKETSRTKQGQAATALIHKHTDIKATLDVLKHPATKFDFALAMLGTSNHIGAKIQAELCQDIAFNLIDEGYKPPKERLMKFENLLKGKADNYFDFSHIMPYELSEEMGQEEINFLGAQAQSRALRGDHNDHLEAQEIENHLYNHTRNEDDKLRRIILRSELLMDQGDYSKALATLTTEVNDELSEDLNKLLKKDSYYMASFLKLCALSGQPLSALEHLAPSIPGLLNDHHPSQRIAYWTLRWIHLTNVNFDNLRDVCLKKLNSLTEVPLFRHDAPGVILACELLDLQSKGYNVDGKTFFDDVKINSQTTTQEWLDLHSPNEEDWLAPLNFNYR